MMILALVDIIFIASKCSIYALGQLLAMDATQAALLTSSCASAESGRWQQTLGMITSCGDTLADSIRVFEKLCVTVTLPLIVRQRYVKSPAF